MPRQYRTAVYHQKHSRTPGSPVPSQTREPQTLNFIGPCWSLHRRREQYLLLLTWRWKIRRLLSTTDSQKANIRRTGDKRQEK